MNRTLIILFSLFVLAETAFAQNHAGARALPEPIGWTNDFGHIFSGEQIAMLDSMISRFEKETTIEIAIVTLDSNRATAGNFDSLVLALHRKWGIGKKETNNGILIGISASLRKIRISNGHGIETRLSDQQTKKILDDTILPDFRKGNIYEGILKGLRAIMEKLR